jgi:periplasmic protein TonB
MSIRAHSVRGPFTLSLVLHGIAGLVLAATVGSGALGRRLPERVEVALAREVEAEPEPPPPPEEEPPEVREPDEVRLAEETGSDEADPRDTDATTAETRSDAWETRGGVLGLGSGRAPRPARRRAPAPVAFPAPEPEDPPPAPPLPPAGPSVRARPLAAECIAPAYPARERRMGVEGVVILLVSIGPGGAVERVEVEESSGSDPLDAAAVAAVRRWRFEPALLEGRPVSDVVLQSVRFRIDQGLATREGR